MRSHIRIEKQDAEPGRPYIVLNDKVIAVGEDGTEVNISSCVMSWQEHSTAGEVRRLQIVLYGYHIRQPDGSTVLIPEDPDDV